MELDIGVICPNCLGLAIISLRDIPQENIYAGHELVLLDDFQNKEFVCSNCNSKVKVLPIREQYELVDDIPT